MEHSDSKGSYAVPANIRRMKPRGTMVKKIKGHYYVYGMKSVKDEKTGRWKTKSLGILGKITEEDGFIPNERNEPEAPAPAPQAADTQPVVPKTPDNGTGYTALEYGTYHLMQICSEDLRKTFIRSFDSRYDSSRRIWSCALIYAVNGFRPLTAMSLLYRNSILSVTAPDLKLGETAMKNQLESLGRRDTESRELQALLSEGVREIAVLRHDIPRSSAIDGMTESDYLCKKRDSGPAVLLTAFDIRKGRPVATGLSEQEKDDAESMRLIDNVQAEGCLYILPRGFSWDELKEKISGTRGTYILPIEPDMKACREMLDPDAVRPKAFSYMYRTGIEARCELVEYRIASDSSGTRIIYYRNLKQAMDRKCACLDCIEKGLPGYSEEELDREEPLFGISAIETNGEGTPEEIFRLYMQREIAERRFDCLLHRLDFNALGLSGWAMLRGAELMLLLAALIRISAEAMLRESRLKGIHLTEALILASALKAVRSGSSWKASSVTEKEGELFAALGEAPSEKPDMMPLLTDLS